MLTLDDCLDICGLTREELRYFVEHEHISELKAAGLAERYIVIDEHGVPRLRRAIVDDIRVLGTRNRPDEARELERFVRDFVLSHPHLNRAPGAKTGS